VITLPLRSLFVSLTLISVACAPSRGLLAAAPAAPAAAPPRAFLLHIPGVSGESFVDHTLLDGFREGRLDADMEIYDWTEHDPGVPALQAIERNKKQAVKIAAKLTAKFRADPRITIYLTSHSGGAGLAAWALEALPPDVKVRRVIFLAPALSPSYDLSKALGHVRDKAYDFYSSHDKLILSVGTQVFGTIDGVYGDAAGYVGFQTPATADAAQYAKLVQRPYDPAWLIYGDDGEHIGPMATAFAKAVLVPLLEGKP
jgi:hypothetical protein